MKKILFITQNSSYFLHRNFSDLFKIYESEIIYIKRRKYKFFKEIFLIIKFFGFLNFFRILFLEIFFKFLKYKSIQNLNSYSIKEDNLNNHLNSILKYQKYSKVISLGCPCKIDSNLQTIYGIPFYNLHGGITPYQKGLYSPLKSLRKGHIYLGSTIHIIDMKFDSGKVESQKVFLIKNRDPLKNYNEVLNLSRELLINFLKNKKFDISEEVKNYFELI